MGSKVVPVIGIALVAGAAFLFLRQRRAAVAGGAPLGPIDQANAAIGSLFGSFGDTIQAGVGSLVGTAADTSKQGIHIAYQTGVALPVAVTRGTANLAVKATDKVVNGVENVFGAIGSIF